MKQQHHVIYVPGILDNIYHIQGAAVRTWRLDGVRSHLHEIPWRGPEKWQPKFDRLLERIDRYAERGHKVSLVGASAGASAIINAYVERRDIISGLVYICAKINGPETVSPKTYKENPAFETALIDLQAKLPVLTAADKAKMMSLYSPGDTYVPHAATIVRGVAERQLPSLQHGRAILYSLTLGAPTILSFLKQRNPA